MTVRCEMIDVHPNEDGLPFETDCRLDAVISVGGVPCCWKHLRARRAENDPEAYPESPLPSRVTPNHGKDTE